MRWWIGVAAVLIVACKPASVPPPLPTFSPVVAPRAAPARTSPWPAGTGDVAGFGPIVPLAIANDGSWVALCQARADTDGEPGIAIDTGYHGEIVGDAIRPYFIHGGGLGSEIDQLVAVSIDTRYVAFTRGGALEIFDATRDVTIALDNADLAGQREHGGPLTLSFSANGKLAIYFRTLGTTTTVIIRDVAAATEREVALPRGVPWAVMPDPSGAWARLYALVDDTDGDGKLTPPAIRHDRGRVTSCKVPAVSYFPYGEIGDRPTEMWLRLDTGQVISDADLIRPVGERMLMRARDGAVFIDSDLAIPRDCKALVTEVLPDPLRILAACDNEGRELRVEAFGKGLRFDTLARRNSGDRTPASLMLDPIHCTPQEGCFDVRHGTVIELHDKFYRSRRGDLLILGQDEGFTTLDVTTNAQRAFDKSSLNALGEHHMLADDKLIELSTGTVIGTLPATTFALDDNGRGLHSTVHVPGSPLSGPLRWVSPTALYYPHAVCRFETLTQLAALDAVLCDDWQDRYDSFSHKWSETDRSGTSTTTRTPRSSTPTCPSRCENTRRSSRSRRTGSRLAAGTTGRSGASAASPDQ